MDSSWERPKGLTADNGETLAIVRPLSVSECVPLHHPSAALHNDDVSILRRQYFVMMVAIAKRHKTVRTFLTNFEKYFCMLA
ncbi:hypothetical protein [Pseudomonas sp. NBRC 111123]|uniref:hypothetical protein n=1 Tax=Pseudomonas sp. NBRC 111123 TaxID=1661038 RepID=UPI0012E1FC2D|nr:hypothetical protein [Pseudomonas sp. NBRC 111123]